ncbi:rod shape-determining protein RodA [Candidatus Daviesbacteria bacterium RIFCSPLOWO2_02_FULL_41_8]|uniref:Rod shape-determining protein RodA n=3 Tax=Candidatus Daviesiibacteriota TaxID=1752718 RepID=A0A1F5NLW4_9BACT|nr:MAG: rod shape-determining protein RodA [Candidatus Daviesbacteria bacterium RIFCSPHIGHO2_01_FULL_41_23]OGE32459.1 MAG: rod shape-determining protein RodA [Candidatus Daviesbacteria bacterium RIFCSPHIGHO2_02_FULL_41_10]OGE61979.1 MAG: rod shape-determining protein RodA [Candidatus Daviesbacteria bacterium RIFCSPLOWO2_01_FULL_41_32]OGE78504.1 MAG: rod shape-determining protein RodA [Candidatus Daviesbacteria bacterium RIFCSPLOWO2_02_FULL_41_8]
MPLQMKNLTSINLPISLISFLLVSIGILVIFSSSRELAIQQSIFTAVGFIFFFLISRIELQSIKNLIRPLYIFILIILVAVLILGIETRGSIRWIPLGIFNIQPSEFAKPILILMLAKFWSENKATWLNVLKSLLWVLPCFFLVFKQPDLGSALTLIAIWLGMLFAANVSVKKMLILGIIALIVIPASWTFLHDYQRDRVLSFIAPEADPLGRGYNVIQSTIAVGSGEFLGRGLGRGTQSRLQFLPEFRTDFIFASISEEMGFVGAMLILSLYLFLLIFCLQAAQKTNNLFSALVIVGTVSMFLFQAFVNMGMNVGLLPITGITLPLISYGGSSAVATLISLGMVASSAGKR